ncbi:serine hydrolase family protein [Candidatus Peregrinibacteria bacterium]|nr:serine hydrolase family protein [Candidatus Peregrinibacteria bacterium]
MKTAFIFHGTGGYPEENWFPWMKRELTKLGYRVFVPQFPTPHNQTPEKWFEVFKEYEKYYNSETILIGHSLGGAFLLRVLEKYDVKIKAAFLVAAPVGVLPIKNLLTDKPFIEKPFDWDMIKSRVEKFAVFHSDNDPYVSLGNGQELAKKLGVDLTFVPNAGHFNKTAGYTEFKLLLDKIN